MASILLQAYDTIRSMSGIPRTTAIDAVYGWASCRTLGRRDDTRQQKHKTWKSGFDAKLFELGILSQPHSFEESHREYQSISHGE